MKYLKDIFKFKKNIDDKLLSEEDIENISDVARDFFEDLDFTRLSHDDLIGFYETPSQDVFSIFKWMQTATINYIEIEVVSSKQFTRHMRLRAIHNHNNLNIVDRLKSMGFKVEVSNINYIQRATRFTIKVYK